MWESDTCVYRELDGGVVFGGKDDSEAILADINRMRKTQNEYMY